MNPLDLVGDAFDPTTEELNANFWPMLRALQERKPLRSSACGGFVAFTRYDDVVSIASDHAAFCSAQGTSPIPGGAQFLLIHSDPPVHSELRRQLAPFFTPRAVAQYEALTRRVASKLIAAAMAKGTCDLIADFAVPLPCFVVYSGVLGAPPDELEKVLGWLERVVNSNDVNAEREITDWSENLLTDWTEKPDEPPVLRAIRGIVVAGEPLDARSKANLLALLILGSLDNTTSALGTLFNVLTSDPELTARLRKNPADIAAAVEECLRIESPVPVLGRIATRDVSVGGCPVKAGEKVLLYWSAANHDPNVFSDPDRIDIDRPHRAHLTFGKGIHACIGASLARMELRVAVEELLRRTTQITRVTAEARYRAAHSRGLLELQVALS